MSKNDNSYQYWFNIFRQDSSGWIKGKPFGVVMERLFNSDVAYYKWESDSVCLVKLLKNKNLKAEVQLTYFNDFTQELKILKETSKGINTNEN